VTWGKECFRFAYFHSDNQRCRLAAALGRRPRAASGQEWKEVQKSGRWMEGRTEGSTGRAKGSSARKWWAAMCLPCPFPPRPAMHLFSTPHHDGLALGRLHCGTSFYLVPGEKKYVPFSSMSATLVAASPDLSCRAAGIQTQDSLYASYASRRLEQASVHHGS